MQDFEAHSSNFAWELLAYNHLEPVPLLRKGADQAAFCVSAAAVSCATGHMR